MALTFAVVRAQLPPQVTPCIENCPAQAVAPGPGRMHRGRPYPSSSSPSRVVIECLCANEKIQQDVLSCLQLQCTTRELEVFQAIDAQRVPAHYVHDDSSSSKLVGGTVPSSHLSSTTSASVTSLANSTSLLSTSSTTPVALSSYSSSESSSSSLLDAASSAPSAAPASTNAAPRLLGHGAVGIYAVLGAVLGSVAVW
ncbi:hypothetical protein V8D89_008611 [Ganoderma adspersum]